MQNMPAETPKPTENKENTDTTKQLAALKQETREREQGMLKQVLQKLDASPQSRVVREVLVAHLTQSLDDPKALAEFKAKQPQNYSMEDLMNGVAEVTWKKNPELLKRYQAGEVPLLEMVIGGLETLMNQAIKQAESLPEPERKQRTDDLNAAIRTMLTATKELVKP